MSFDAPDRDSTVDVRRIDDAVPGTYRLRAESTVAADDVPTNSDFPALGRWLRVSVVSDHASDPAAEPKVWIEIPAHLRSRLADEQPPTGSVMTLRNLAKVDGEWRMTVDFEENAESGA